jgi:hypothetical protein
MAEKERPMPQQDDENPKQVPPRRNAKTATALILGGAAALLAIALLTDSANITTEAALCDWGSRTTFAECLSRSFSGQPLSELQDYLLAEEFVPFGVDNIDGRPRHSFGRTANNLGGYRIIVFVSVSSNGQVMTITTN